ncbi:MAG: AAA family ATPase, partial [Saccharofermentanales bacterium]
MLKILHTADWHIGRYVGPQTDDFAIKMAKTKEILDELVATAKEEQPDLILICGDLFHQERVWADRGMKEVRFVADYIIKLMDLSRVIVIKGTPSHDGDEQYKVLQDMLGDDVIYTNAQIVSEDIYQVLTLPAMDKATVRQNLENQEIKLTPEQENIELSRILSDTLHGFVAQRNHEKPLILAGHYSVTGAKNDNGQDIMFNTDVCLIKEELEQLDIDLICLGHIHGQQQVCSNGWYSGSIDRLNFSDEGKNKGVLVHTMDYIGQTETVTFTLPARQYLTIEVNEKDLKYITLGRQYVLDNVQNKVVRFLYSAPKELDRQLDKKAIEKALYDSGAYYVTEICNTTDTEGMNRETIVSATEEESLLRWLDEKYGEDLPLEDRILSAGTEIIQTARASRPDGGQTGIFIPQNITVRNYRSYASESVDFDSFDFAMVNGPNGAGKSSLFMDAIAECLYKETREGDLAGWVRKGQRSGTIEFTFLLGQSTYKVIRSRQQSGGGSLDIMRLKDDLWHNISESTMDLTQKKIEDLLGMDAYTFKTCALIMQDQYGKFMEAKPEDRMDALGYVLGLGIYSDMEKIARNNYTEENRILRDLKEKLSELKQDAEGEEEVSARIESLG